MSLRDGFRKRLNNAVRDKDEVAAATMRLVIAALNDRGLTDTSEGENDEEILELARNMVKQRLESADNYDKSGRPHMAERERREIEIIREFLPPRMDDKELSAVAAASIKDCGATSLKDLGAVMAQLKKRCRGRVSTSRASVVVRKMLEK